MQNGETTVHQVRQAGFKVHEVARECKSETARAIGQAIGVAHMREHTMVATDYAIKAVSLDSQEDMIRITKEREWQLHEFKNIK